MFERLDSAMVEAFEGWLKRRGLAPNTISFYNRILRTLYYRAAAEGGFEARPIFRGVFTGVAKTAKRALPMSVLRRIMRLDLSSAPALDFARDMFLMSFSLRGMSFIDMAFLRKADLRNGHITYRRSKTSQQLNIAWTKEMQAIVDKYPANKTEYLLPIITSDEIDARAMYLRRSQQICHQLKKVQKALGLTVPLTMYVARHSWASAAQRSNIPVSVISEGMGHNSEKTTRIYLAGIETSAVDKANEKILSLLKKMA